MTDTQRKIIEIAGDKKQSIGCIIERSETYFRQGSGWHNSGELGVLIKPGLGKYKSTGLCECKYKIIGHPIHVGHLMRLSFEKPKNDFLESIIVRFNNNLNLYSQDCLYWDEDTNQLILDYLLTVKGAN